MRTSCFGLAIASLLSCRTPTEIEVSLQGRGLTCEEGAPFAHYESGVLVRERFANQDAVKAALGTEKSYASSQTCAGLSDPALTDLGNSVVVPTELPERVEVLAVAGFDRYPNDDVAAPSVLQCLEFFDPGAPGCPSEEPARSECRSCIFATRSLAFLEFSSLKLSVELDTRCAGKICPEGETCFQGECESNAVSCEASGCSIPGELGGSGAGGSGAGGSGGEGGQGGGALGWLTAELEVVDGTGVDLYGVTDSGAMQLFAAHGALSRITIDGAGLTVTPELDNPADGEITYVGGPAFGTTVDDVRFGGLRGGALDPKFGSCSLPGSVQDCTLHDVGRKTECSDQAALTGFSGPGSYFALQGTEESCRPFFQRADIVVSRDVGPITDGDLVSAFVAFASGPKEGTNEPKEYVLTRRRGDLEGQIALWIDGREFVPGLTPNGLSFVDPPALRPLLAVTPLPLIDPPNPLAPSVRLLTVGVDVNVGLRLNTLELTSGGLGVGAQAIPSNLTKVIGLTTNLGGDAYLLGYVNNDSVIERFSVDVNGAWTRCSLPVDVSMLFPDAWEVPIGIHPIWANDDVLALAMGHTVAILPGAGGRFDDATCVSQGTQGTDLVVETPDPPMPIGSSDDGVWTTIDFPGETLDLVMPTTPVGALLLAANGGNLAALAVTSGPVGAPPSVTFFPDPGLIAKAVGIALQSPDPQDYTIGRYRNDQIEVCDRNEDCQPYEPAIDCAPPYRVRVAGGGLGAYVLAYEGNQNAIPCARLETAPAAASGGISPPALAGVSASIVDPAGPANGSPLFGVYNSAAEGPSVYRIGVLSPLGAVDPWEERGHLVSFPQAGGYRLIGSIAGGVRRLDADLAGETTPVDLSLGAQEVVALAASQVDATDFETFILGIDPMGPRVWRLIPEGNGDLGCFEPQFELPMELTLAPPEAGKQLAVTPGFVAIGWSTGSGFRVAIRARGPSDALPSPVACVSAQPNPGLPGPP